MLDDWLKKRARANQASGARRTYVVAEDGGRVIGAALLQDAVLRSGQAAAIMGIRGLLVHALDDKARAFYDHFGFKGSPASPLTLSLKQPG